MSQGLDLSEAGLIAVGLLTNRWEPATREQLDAALIHHDRILDDLALLLRRSAYVHRHPERRISFLEVTEHPTRAMLGLLEQHPRLAGESTRTPSDVLTEHPPLGGPWRDLNRALLVAAHDWGQAGAVPPADVRWGVVADVAAITRAVSLLHPDLARAAQDLNVPRVRRFLKAPTSVALRPVSAAALELAEGGPTLDGWRPAVSRPLAHLVNDLHGALDHTEIPSAAEALARVLHHSSLRLDAETTIMLIRNHGATSLDVGHYLTRIGDYRGAALIQHGEALSRAGTHLHNRIWSEPSPPAHRRPLAQAEQLRQITRAHFRATPTDVRSHVIAAEYARVVPAITSQLGAHLARAAELGQWMTINRDTDRADLHWRPIRGADFPEARKAMRAAIKSVTDLGPTQAPSLPGVLNHPNSAHRLLAPALARAATNPEQGRRPLRP